jgi:hypothetical protein
MFCSLVLKELLFIYFWVPSSSHNATLFFFSLHTCLLCTPTPCTRLLHLFRGSSFVSSSWMFCHLFHHHLHHWCFVSAYFYHCHLFLPISTITTCFHLPISTYFHHYCLFSLACSRLLPPSFLVLACFCHHRLLLYASPHHHHLFLLTCSRLLLAS